MDKRSTNGRFLTGNSGGGRPKGSRNRLSEAFLNDLHTVWEREGKAAIERTLSERPWEFIRVVASVIPKELDLGVNDGPASAVINLSIGPHIPAALEPPEQPGAVER